MRKAHIAVVTAMVVAGLTGTVAGPASASPPTVAPAEHLCNQQNQNGGIFIPGSVDPVFYACDATVAPGFTAAELRAARAICEGTFKGSFSETEPGETVYQCRPSVG